MSEWKLFERWDFIKLKDHKIAGKKFVLASM